MCKPLVNKTDEKKSSLLCVKSVITIIMTIAFAILCFIYPEDYTDTMKMISVSVITFYFSHQVDKNATKKKEGENNEKA